MVSGRVRTRDRGHVMRVVVIARGLLYRPHDAHDRDERPHQDVLSRASPGERVDLLAEPYSQLTRGGLDRQPQMKGPACAIVVCDCM